MTLYRLNESTFQRLPEEIQEAVRRAVCAQIEYLDANGDMDNETTMQSAGLGKFSYTAAAVGSLSNYAPRAQRILMPTGLLYRGGGW